MCVVDSEGGLDPSRDSDGWHAAATPRPRRGCSAETRRGDAAPRETGRRYSFGSGSTIAAGGYYLLCCGSDDVPGGTFGINPFDAISLLDATGAEVSTAGPMTGDGGSPGVTYAWDGASYVYTSAATPGASNEYSPVVPLKTRLAAQNAEGDWFWGTDSSGKAIPSADAIVTMKITMSDADWAYTKEKAYEETFKPFTKVTVWAGTDAGSRRRRGSPSRAPRTIRVAAAGVDATKR